MSIIPSSQGACRAPSAVVDEAFGYHGGQSGLNPALCVARELHVLHKHDGINPCSWEERACARRKEQTGYRQSFGLEPGMLQAVSRPAGQEQSEWGRKQVRLGEG